jgi:hypothetical protein
MTLTTPQFDHGSISTESWELRLSRDLEAIEQFVPIVLRNLHKTVVARAQEAEAHGLVLSGSTARGKRTEISDLDYHVIGRKIDTSDLSPELDLHVLSTKELETDVLAGDDFIQWSLRFGRVIFDDGTLLRALRLMADRRPWPDVERKQRHAAKSLELARRVVATGDEDGALLQVRTALSLAARAHLIARGEFPMTRAELPDQLEAAGHAAAAHALQSCIHGQPSLAALHDAVSEGLVLLGRAGATAAHR